MPITIIKDDATGHLEYQLPGSFGKFTMPPIPESESETIPVVFFKSAVDDLGIYADTAPTIAGDRYLSDIGRAKKLEPIQTNLVLRVAHVDNQLDVEGRHFDKLEQELMAVPRIEQTYTVAAIEDREIRDWWRQQPAKERAEMLKRIESEPGHERFLIAMMRSPVPQLDHEVNFVADVWKRMKRLESPGKALAIDRGRANVEWARRGLGHVAGMSKMMLKWDDNRIARTMLTSADPVHHGGYKAFGIDAMAAEMVKRAIAAESRVRY
jgi:hypothetical protein